MSEPAKIRSLTDAEPGGGAERKSELSPELLALCAAHDRLRAAQAAVDAHRPPYAGPDWTQKTRAYRDAKDALAVLFEEIKRGTS